MQLFIDTWGWIALLNKREPRHEEVKAYFQDFISQSGAAYTTDYVLDETLTLLFKRLPFVRAQESLQWIERAVQTGGLQLAWITPERFAEAKRLRLRYQDKPSISFTDLTSMAVMRERDILDVLTADEHFVRVGMDFRLCP